MWIVAEKYSSHYDVLHVLILPIEIGTVQQLISYCVKKNGGCEHKCKDGPHGPACSCFRGYHLKPNNKSCAGMVS